MLALLLVPAGPFDQHVIAVATSELVVSGAAVDKLREVGNRNRCEVKSLTTACQTQFIVTSAGLDVDEPLEACIEFREVEGVVARCSHDFQSLDFGG